MNKKNGKYPVSQSAQLNAIGKSATWVVRIGIALLLIFTALNLYLTYVNSDQLESTTLLNQYRIGSKSLTYAVQSYAVTGNEDYYDNYMKELNEDKNRDIAWAGLKENDITDEEWKELETISSLSNNLVPLEEEAMELTASNKREEAADIVFGEEYEDAVSTITTKTDECIASIQSRLAKKQTVILIAVLVSEALFAIAFIYIVLKIVEIMKFSRKELLQPIVSVSAEMNELAKGNLHNEFELAIDESEVGQLAGAIAFMKKNFTDMIEEIGHVLGMMGNGKYNVSVTQEYVGEFTAIKDSMLKIIADTKQTMQTISEVTQEIEGGSEQLAQAASDLAEGSTTQAAKVTEVSDLIAAMTEKMRENAKEAQLTVDLSTIAGQKLQIGNAKMMELKEAISDISDCSNEIRTIIATIDDIANQTNLLSLNAAIEAARAGEAGKGFAVVAEQVKNLAAQSAEAAGETTQLIQRTIDAVDKGIAIADETASSMDEIMANAQASTEKMMQMTTSLSEEAENMIMIDENVSKVAEIVDNNSATSEETAAVSQEQSAQVTTMVQLMEQFEFE